MQPGWLALLLVATLFLFFFISSARQNHLLSFLLLSEMVCKTIHFTSLDSRTHLIEKPKHPPGDRKSLASRAAAVCKALWFPADSALPEVYLIGFRGGRQSRAPSHGKQLTALNQPTHHLHRAVSSQSFRLSFGF